MAEQIANINTRSKIDVWDIESYKNYFCTGFIDRDNVLHMHYLVNNKEDEKLVIQACVDSGYTFRTYNLSKDASVLLKKFKKITPKVSTDSLLGNFLDWSDEHVIQDDDAINLAYNSLSYDIQMIEYLKKSIIGNRVQTTTEALRAYSDTLINNTALRSNTTEYEKYNGQVDAAFLNETMIEKGRPTIGLKTLVGLKGGSIIESESNKSGYSKDVYMDTLYNINDISELRDVVFPGKMEQTLNIRKKLLESYPSLDANNVTPNSTSAKFVEYIVAPDGPIDDIPVVDFMYPAKHIAKKLGVPQTDILEDTKQWYIENVYKVVSKHNPKAANDHLAKFLTIYDYYAYFRGKNWNESSRHAMKYGIPAHPKSERRDILRQFGTYILLIDKYGNNSYTYENFSAGGIHGAEIFKEQLERDRQRIKELRDKYKYISAIPKSEKVPGALLSLIKVQSRTNYKGYPQHLMHEIPYLYHQTTPVDEILDPEDFTPFLYTEKQDKTTGEIKGSEGLIKRYAYTSSGHTVHQDFAGYYPMRVTRSQLKRLCA